MKNYRTRQERVANLQANFGSFLQGKVQHIDARDIFLVEKGHIFLLTLGEF